MALPPILSNLRLPVIGAPLFIISNPNLVIAQCKAGIVGSFPALNARPASQLDEWIHEVIEALAAHDREHPDKPAAPFAVNQIVHRSNDRFEDDMNVCAKWKVPIVITSLGARTELNDAVHGWGGITLHDVIDDRFARKAIEKGADGLIAVAAGAGGHAGRWSPFALVHEIRRWFDGPLILSGAIATGRAVLAAQQAAGPVRQRQKRSQKRSCGNYGYRRERLDAINGIVEQQRIHLHPAMGSERVEFCAKHQLGGRAVACQKG